MAIDGEAWRLHERFKRRELSPVEIARAHLEAIASLDQAVNAFVLVDDKVAMDMAKASEARYRRGESLGLLDGVPVTFKDTVTVAGWSTRRGSRTSAETPAETDTVSVARLRGAGAVFLGKTATPEFAWKGLTESPLRGVTRNPLNPAYHAGGSSGGAAAATALGLGTIGIGTDAAGSVRIPAAFCGVVGYKATFGTIPLDPYPAAFWRLPHIGPIAQTVADTVAVAKIMSGPAASDWTSLAQTSLDVRLAEKAAVSGLRIGVPSGLDRYLQPDVKSVWEEALAAIASEFQTKSVDVALGEARDIVGSLYRLGCAYAVSQIAKDRRCDLDPALLEFVEPVRNLGADQLVQLQRRREEIASRTTMLLINDVDLLLTPTMPCLPLTVGGEPSIANNWLDWCPFTPLFNLTGGPALSVPWRNSNPKAFPIGLQVGAAPGRDDVAITGAAIIEELAEQRHPRSVRTSAYAP